MGLIKAAIGAVTGTMADAWKEYFYCDAIDGDTLIVKGMKRVNGKRSSNIHGNENVITNGSKITVNEGQCLLIVDNGKIVDIAAEAGDYIYDASMAPSIFDGGLGDAIKNTFNEAWNRFEYGGDVSRDNRIYYVNTKEIVGNKYGTPNAVPFRVIDTNIGLDVDISIRCFGEYSYKITNPILFYKNVSGNVTQDYKRYEIDSQLKTELMTALQPAFAKISAMGIRYSQLPAHTTEIAKALNEELSSKWAETRGIEIASFGVSSVSASEEDEKMLKQLQSTAVNRDPRMAAASLVGAQAQAMRDAANNPSGAFTGFMGMNMANMSGGFDAQSLYGQSAPQQPQQQPQQASNTWKCECGNENTGNFCSNCGKPKPSPNWQCECGNVNTGKFCSNCGKPRG